MVQRFKLVFFTPHPQLEAIKTAIFAVDAGTYPGGKYSHVCFQMPGQAQFLPEMNRGANPHIGVPGRLEVVDEMRVEILCVGQDVMREAVLALKRVHPYEEPAYEVYRMEDV
ncbi:MAG: hypothetical protein M1817_002185 [Caeruleum heppii]|nr:MAG: hypothetical protein M1817_002185 [Caeruleum heppii]